ncbi:MAG: branched-chain amino acid ABC transporter permease [Thermodesulfobacteriota bacterium]
MKQAKLNALVYGLFFAMVAVMGFFFTNPYYQQLVTFIGINVLLAVGLNMLMGYAGQISLGHAAFFGLGAYATGVVTVHLSWSPWLGLVAAVVLCALVAYLVGLPTLKLTGYYLAMGTLGFGMIVLVVFQHWLGVTGGPSGLVGIPELTLGRISLSTGRNCLWLTWGLVGISFFVCQRIISSRVGRALRAVHFSERAAAAVGVNTAGAKLSVFVFSAVLAGIAGFLYAHTVSFISPGSFSFLTSIRLVAMVVIGGMASIWGSLFGAALLTLLPEFLHIFSDYEMVIYGLILMLVMIFFPEGLFVEARNALQRNWRRNAGN